MLAQRKLCTATYMVETMSGSSLAINNILPLQVHNHQKKNTEIISKAINLL
jgi:hypothetical protein